MKNIVKKIAMVVATTGLLFAASSQAMIELPNPSSYFKKAKKSPVKLLFTIEAKHGVLRHIKGAQYELAIPVNEIKSVLVFSDRPNRLAFRMSPQKYHDLVYSGSNNFDVDPPNVVLSWGDQSHPAEAYTVTGHRKNHDLMMYSLTKLGKHAHIPAANKGRVSIFIDDADANGSAPQAEFDSACEADYGEGSADCKMWWVDGLGVMCGPHVAPGACSAYSVAAYV